MSLFTKHSPQTAPQDAQQRLQAAQDTLGFVPSMYGMMANAPTLLEGYQTLSEIFARSSFSNVEQQVVLLAISVSNRCEFCVAAHTTLAQGAGVEASIVDALRHGRPLNDSRLQSIVQLAQAIVKDQGWANKEVDEFLEQGFEHQQVLEIVLAAGLKTLSNYTNHLANPPIDAAFVKNAWSAKDFLS